MSGWQSNTGDIEGAYPEHFSAEHTCKENGLFDGERPRPHDSLQALLELGAA